MIGSTVILNLLLQNEMGKTKTMIDKDFEQIALILEEAERFGLRWEVEQTAIKEIKENPDIDPVQAYENAYGDWIK